MSGVEGKKTAAISPLAFCFVSLAFHSTRVTRHSYLAAHFLFIVPIELVRIPMISSSSSILCLTTSLALASASSVRNDPLVSRAEPRAMSRKRAYSIRLSRPKPSSMFAQIESALPICCDTSR